MGIRNFSNNIKRVMLKIKIVRAELYPFIFVHIFATLLRRKMLHFVTTKFKRITILITTLLLIVNARLFFQQLIHKLFKQILRLYKQIDYWLYGYEYKSNSYINWTAKKALYFDCFICSVPNIGFVCVRK